MEFCDTWTMKALEREDMNGTEWNAIKKKQVITLWQRAFSKALVIYKIIVKGQEHFDLEQNFTNQQKW